MDGADAVDISTLCSGLIKEIESSVDSSQLYSSLMKTCTNPYLSFTAADVCSDVPSDWDLGKSNVQVADVVSNFVETEYPVIIDTEPEGGGGEVSIAIDNFTTGLEDFNQEAAASWMQVEKIQSPAKTPKVPEKNTENAKERKKYTAKALPDFITLKPCRVLMDKLNLGGDIEIESEANSEKHLCTHCSKWLPSEEMLKSHQKSAHGRSELFHCVRCSLTFEHHGTFRQHVQVKHGINKPISRAKKQNQRVSTPDAERRNQPSGRIVCNGCNEPFDDRVTLGVHARRFKCGLVEARVAKANILMKTTLTQLDSAAKKKIQQGKTESQAAEDVQVTPAEIQPVEAVQVTAAEPPQPIAVVPEPSVSTTTELLTPINLDDDSTKSKDSDIEVISEVKQSQTTPITVFSANSQDMLLQKIVNPQDFFFSGKKQKIVQRLVIRASNSKSLLLPRPPPITIPMQSNLVRCSQCCSLVLKGENHKCKMHKCNICQVSFICTYDTLLAHMKSAHNVCPPKVVPRVPSLTIVQPKNAAEEMPIDVVSSDPLPSTPSVSEKPLTHNCTQCKATFSNKKSLNRHLKRHLQHASVARTPSAVVFMKSASSLQKETQELSVANTFLSLQRPSAIKIAKSIPVPVSSKDAVNRGVGDKFVSPVPHSLIQPLRMLECGKLFGSAETESQRPQCPLCNKYFSTENYVKNHILRVHQVHTRQKVEECPLCDKRFMKHGLATHMVRVHPDQAKPFNTKSKGQGKIRPIKPSASESPNALKIPNPIASEPAASPTVAETVTPAAVLLPELPMVPQLDLPSSPAKASVLLSELESANAAPVVPQQDIPMIPVQTAALLPEIEPANAVMMELQLGLDQPEILLPEPEPASAVPAGPQLDLPKSLAEAAPEMVVAAEPVADSETAPAPGQPINSNEPEEKVKGQSVKSRIKTATGKLAKPTQAAKETPAKQKSSRTSAPDPINVLLGSDKIYEFQCTTCLIFFSSMEALRAHEVIHEEAKVAKSKRQSAAKLQDVEEQPAPKKMKRSAKDYQMELDILNDILIDSVPAASREGDVQCDECGETFDSLKKQEDHLATVHGRVLYEIPANSHMLPLEIESSLRNLREFICNTCGEIFYKQDEMYRHATSHLVHSKHLEPLRSRSVLCTLCKQEVKEAFLFSHLVRFHSKFMPERVPNSCPVCSYKGHEVNSFFQHLRLKHNRAVLECELCRVAYRELKFLQQHVMEMHGVDLDEYLEEIQPLKKLVQVSIAEESKEAQGEELKECLDKDFEEPFEESLDDSNDEDLEDDFIEPLEDYEEEFNEPLENNKEEFNELIEEENEDISCHHCSEDFSNRTKLEQHLQDKHMRQLPWVPVFQPKATLQLCPTPQSNSLFVCERCKEPFLKRGSLKKHVKRARCSSDRMRRPWMPVCSLCRTVCPNRFVYAAHLVLQHTQSRAPDEPEGIICTRCGACFSGCADLCQHARTAHKMEAFNCFACNMAFQDMVSLRDHMVDDHGLVQMKEIAFYSSPKKVPKAVVKVKKSKTIIVKKKNTYLARVTNCARQLALRKLIAKGKQSISKRPKKPAESPAPTPEPSTLNPGLREDFAEGRDKHESADSSSSTFHETDAQLSTPSYVRLLEIPSLDPRKFLTVELPKSAKESNLEELLQKMEYLNGTLVSQISRLEYPTSSKTAAMLNKTWRLMQKSNMKQAFYRDTTGRYQCRICVFRSVSRSIIQFHTEKNHTKEAKSFLHPGDDNKARQIPVKTKAHIKTTVAKNLLVKQKQRSNCSHCDKSFVNLMGLEVHTLRVHKIKLNTAVLNCKQCDRTFNSSLAFAMHVRRAHLGFNPNCRQRKKMVYQQPLLSCPHCTKRFINKAGLMTHIKIVHCKPKKETKMSYECPKCDRYFKNMISLSRHHTAAHRQRLKTPLCYRTCQICDKQFLRRDSLTNHLLYVHQLRTSDDGGHQKCKTCGSSFPNLSSLVNHYWRVHGERLEHPSMVLKCPQCKKILPRHALKTHIQTVHEQRSSKSAGPHKCKKCGSHFRTFSGLNTHSLMVHGLHLPSRRLTFKCHECGKIFPEKGLLASHMLRVHVDRLSKSAGLHECQHCVSHYQTYQGLRVHSLSVHGVTLENPKPNMECNECKKIFTYKGKMASHILRVHVQRSIEHPGYQKCKKCGSSFSTFRSLASHHWHVHGERLEHPSKLLKCPLCKKEMPRLSLMSHIKNVHSMRSSESSGTHKCKKCGSHYKSRKGLKFHQQSVHAKHGPKGPFECNECGKKFSSKSRLIGHILGVHINRTFESSGPFKCKMCVSHFHSRGALTYHCSCVHPQSALECDECGKVLYDKDYLAQHMMTHIQKLETPSEWPKCPQCNKSVPSYSLKQHIEHVHSTRVAKRYKCPSCATSFNSITGLAFHLRHTHDQTLLPPDRSLHCTLCDNAPRQAWTTYLGFCNHMSRVHKQKPLPPGCCKQDLGGKKFQYSCMACGLILPSVEFFWHHRRYSTTCPERLVLPEEESAELQPKEELAEVDEAAKEAPVAELAKADEAVEEAPVAEPEEQELHPKVEVLDEPAVATLQVPEAPPAEMPVQRQFPHETSYSDEEEEEKPVALGSVIGKAKERHIFCLGCRRDLHLAAYLVHVGECYRGKTRQPVECSMCDSVVQGAKLMPHVARHLDCSGNTEPTACKICNIALFNHSNYLNHNLEIHM